MDAFVYIMSTVVVWLFVLYPRSGRAWSPRSSIVRRAVKPDRFLDGL